MSIELALVKVKKSDGRDLTHFMSAFGADLLLTQKIAYVAAGNGAGQAEYIGLTLPGTATTEARWLIKKLTYDASNRVTDVQFANGVILFDQVWDDRAGLSYS